MLNPGAGRKAERPHPALVDWLERLNRLMAEQTLHGVEVTPVTLRESLATMTANLVTQRPELSWVRDTMVPTDGYPVPVRLYDPAPDRAKPVCLFFHGGGHMTGGISVYDPICRKLAEATGHLLVSVEYRLAPECPYPLGLKDCYAVARHLWPVLEKQGLRIERSLNLVGDSGGGALAATVSALAQDNPDLRIDKQVLIYPSLDYTLTQPSVAENGKGYLLETSRILWYFDHYFQHRESTRQQEERRAASPLYMPITGEMPDTLIVSAGFCPLRDEALAYANKLNAAGVPCQQVSFPDMIHAFLNLEDLVPEACARTYRTLAEFLNAPGAAV